MGQFREADSQEEFGARTCSGLYTAMPASTPSIVLPASNYYMLGCMTMDKATAAIAKGALVDDDDATILVECVTARGVELAAALPLYSSWPTTGGTMYIGQSGAVGRDSQICLVEKLADDKNGGGWTGSHTGTTAWTAVGTTFTPAPAGATDYLVIGLEQLYHSATSSRGQFRFYHNTTVLGTGFQLTPATTSYNEWRTAMYLGKRTINTTDTLTMQAAVSNAGDTLNGRNGGYILLPWDDFEDPQLAEDTFPRTVSSPTTSYKDFSTFGGLSYTPGAAGDHLLLVVGQMAGGSGSNTVWVTCDVDGTDKMEAEHVTAAASPIRDQHIYFWPAIVNFPDTTTRTIKFQGKLQSGGTSPYLYRQSMFCGRIPSGRRLVAARGIVGAGNRIVTAAHPGR